MDDTNDKMSDTVSSSNISVGVPFHSTDSLSSFNLNQVDGYQVQDKTILDCRSSIDSNLSFPSREPSLMDELRMSLANKVFMKPKSSPHGNVSLDFSLSSSGSHNSTINTKGSKQVLKSRKLFNRPRKKDPNINFTLGDESSSSTDSQQSHDTSMNLSRIDASKPVFKRPRSDSDGPRKKDLNINFTLGNESSSSTDLEQSHDTSMSLSRIDASKPVFKRPQSNSDRPQKKALNINFTLEDEFSSSTDNEQSHDTSMNLSRIDASKPVFKCRQSDLDRPRKKDLNINFTLGNESSSSTENEQSHDTSVNLSRIDASETVFNRLQTKTVSVKFDCDVSNDCKISLDQESVLDVTKLPNASNVTKDGSLHGAVANADRADDEIPQRKPTHSECSASIEASMVTEVQHLECSQARTDSDPTFNVIQKPLALREKQALQDDLSDSRRTCPATHCPVSHKNHSSNSPDSNINNQADEEVSGSSTQSLVFGDLKSDVAGRMDITSSVSYESNVLDNILSNSFVSEPECSIPPIHSMHDEQSLSQESSEKLSADGHAVAEQSFATPVSGDGVKAQPDKKQSENKKSVLNSTSAEESCMSIDNDLSNNMSVDTSKITVSKTEFRRQRSKRVSVKFDCDGSSFDNEGTPGSGTNNESIKHDTFTVRQTAGTSAWRRSNAPNKNVTVNLSLGSLDRPDESVEPSEKLLSEDAAVAEESFACQVAGDAAKVLLEKENEPKNKKSVSNSSNAEESCMSVDNDLSNNMSMDTSKITVFKTEFRRQRSKRISVKFDCDGSSFDDRGNQGSLNVTNSESSNEHKGSVPPASSVHVETSLNEQPAKKLVPEDDAVAEESFASQVSGDGAKALLEKKKHPRNKTSVLNSTNAEESCMSVDSDLSNNTNVDTSKLTVFKTEFIRQGSKRISVKFDCDGSSFDDRGNHGSLNVTNSESIINEHKGSVPPATPIHVETSLNEEPSEKLVPEDGAVAEESFASQVSGDGAKALLEKKKHPKKKKSVLNSTNAEESCKSVDNDLSNNMSMDTSKITVFKTEFRRQRSKRISVKFDCDGSSFDDRGNQGSLNVTNSESSNEHKGSVPPASSVHVETSLNEQPAKKLVPEDDAVAEESFASQVSGDGAKALLEKKKHPRNKTSVLNSTNAEESCMSVDKDLSNNTSMDISKVTVPKTEFRRLKSKRVSVKFDCDGSSFDTETQGSGTSNESINDDTFTVRRTARTSAWRRSNTANKNVTVNLSLGSSDRTDESVETAPSDHHTLELSADGMKCSKMVLSTFKDTPVTLSKPGDDECIRTEGDSTDLPKQSSALSEKSRMLDHVVEKVYSKFLEESCTINSNTVIRCSQENIPDENTFRQNEESSNTLNKVCKTRDSDDISLAISLEESDKSTEMSLHGPAGLSNNEMILGVSESSVCDVGSMNLTKADHVSKVRKVNEIVNIDFTLSSTTTSIASKDVDSVSQSLSKSPVQANPLKKKVLRSTKISIPFSPFNSAEGDIIDVFEAGDSNAADESRTLASHQENVGKEDLICNTTVINDVYTEEIVVPISCHSVDGASIREADSNRVGADDHDQSGITASSFQDHQKTTEVVPADKNSLTNTLRSKSGLLTEGRKRKRVRHDFTLSDTTISNETTTASGDSIEPKCGLKRSSKNRGTSDMTLRSFDGRTDRGKNHSHVFATVDAVTENNNINLDDEDDIGLLAVPSGNGSKATSPEVNQSREKNSTEDEELHLVVSLGDLDNRSICLNSVADVSDAKLSNKSVILVAAEKCADSPQTELTLPSNSTAEKYIGNIQPGGEIDSDIIPTQTSSQQINSPGKSTANVLNREGIYTQNIILAPSSTNSLIQPSTDKYGHNSVDKASVTNGRSPANAPLSPDLCIIPPNENSEVSEGIQSSANNNHEVPIKSNDDIPLPPSIAVDAISRQTPTEKVSKSKRKSVSFKPAHNVYHSPPDYHRNEADQNSSASASRREGEGCCEFSKIQMTSEISEIQTSVRVTRSKKHYSSTPLPKPKKQRVASYCRFPTDQAQAIPDDKIFAKPYSVTAAEHANNEFLVPPPPLFATKPDTRPKAHPVRSPKEGEENQASGKDSSSSDKTSVDLSYENSLNISVIPKDQAGPKWGSVIFHSTPLHRTKPSKKKSRKKELSAVHHPIEEDCNLDSDRTANTSRNLRSRSRQESLISKSRGSSQSSDQSGNEDRSSQRTNSSSRSSHAQSYEQSESQERSTVSLNPVSNESTSDNTSPDRISIKDNTVLSSQAISHSRARDFASSKSSRSSYMTRGSSYNSYDSHRKLPSRRLFTTSEEKENDDANQEIVESPSGTNVPKIPDSLAVEAASTHHTDLLDDDGNVDYDVASRDDSVASSSAESVAPHIVPHESLRSQIDSLRRSSRASSVSSDGSEVSQPRECRHHGHLRPKNEQSTKTSVESKKPRSKFSMRTRKSNSENSLIFPKRPKRRRAIKASENDENPAEWSRKPRKLFKPGKWASKKLYNWLELKLRAKHGLKTTLMAEKVVIDLQHACLMVSNGHLDGALDTVRERSVELGLCTTQLEFWSFINKFMPFDFRMKVIPMGGAFGSAVAPRTLPYDAL